MSEIAKYEQPSLAVRDQVNQIQALMENTLQEGQHYGKVPGCGPKPTLLLPGAEKIALMFGWSYDTEVTERELENGHREYSCKVKLIDRKTGQLMGTGIGLCSTMESKYRYRKDKRTGKRAENGDIADVYNTVLKMAKKRAFVDAVKSTAAASDIFTQDIEDMPVYEVQQVAQAEPAKQQPPQRDPRLDPIRERMHPFMQKLGYGSSDATRCILDYAGRGSMDQLTDEDIASVTEYMDGIIGTEAMVDG